MSNILILYWQPGSGGDFVQSLLLSETDRYCGVIEQFDNCSNGRVLPSIDKKYKDMFKHDPDQWYSRRWTSSDVDMLKNIIKKIGTKIFVIPTHNDCEVDFLKSQFPKSTSVGITYPLSMFPAVLKNWCKKVVPSDNSINKIYNQPKHQYLKDNNVFGEFVLKEQLKFGHCIQSSVSDRFDINISLEDLYIGNVEAVKTICNDLPTVSDKLKSWLLVQSSIHQYNYTICDILKGALGNNSKATYQGSLDISLDNFDNVLIKEFCQTNKLGKNIPNFVNLKEANTFFEDTSNL